MKGIIHYEFMRSGQTINSKYIIEVHKKYKNMDPAMINKNVQLFCKTTQNCLLQTEVRGDRI